MSLICAAWLNGNFLILAEKLVVLFGTQVWFFFSIAKILLGQGLEDGGLLAMLSNSRWALTVKLEKIISKYERKYFTLEV